MPGATLEVLKLAEVDLDKLVADCRCLELAMARGNSLELVTYSAGGTPHVLKADIGGWDRLPVASDGIIGDGAWGNVPSGETYIAPLEGTAEGSVAINGSVPGLVLATGDELVLTFEHGRLTGLLPEQGTAAAWLRRTQISGARARGDIHWSNLAEIGVGLNPGVGRLTGNMLLDEKAAGTAHIALGSNTFMGGTVDSTIHCDLVTREATMSVDGRRVIDRGRLVYVESDWHEHYSQVSLKDSPLTSAVRVARSGVQVASGTEGELRRILRPEPGRVSKCQVGSHETARLANALYGLLPEHEDGMMLEELATRANMDAETARKVLHVLLQYDLVRAW
jgi:hypothetical protein